MELQLAPLGEIWNIHNQKKRGVKIKGSDIRTVAFHPHLGFPGRGDQVSTGSVLGPVILL